MSPAPAFGGPEAGGLCLNRLPSNDRSSFSDDDGVPRPRGFVLEYSRKDDKVVSFVELLLFVVRFAGCAQLTGSILHDAILGNVHMLSFVDNRPFYALYHELETMILARRPPEESADVLATRRPFRSFP